MDRKLDRSWRVAFIAGVAALALSVGGQVATSVPSADVASCPLAARPSVAQRLYDHFAPQVRAHSVAHRVALALLGAMLHDSCS